MTVRGVNYNISEITLRKRIITCSFIRILWKVSVASTLIKLVAVPLALINAKLISDLVISATNGIYSDVLLKGGLILLIILGGKIFEMFIRTSYESMKSNEVHKCKIKLYRHYIRSPLHILYNSSAGEAKVMMNEDFSTITEKVTESYPLVVSGLLAVITYFAILCSRSPFLGCVLVFISVLQVFPPLVFKGFYEKYDVLDKDMEKQVTDCVLEFCNGFSTIKMLHLTEWSLQRMKNLHSKWARIANRLQATARADMAFDTTISNILSYGTYAIVGLFILWRIIETDLGIEAIALSGNLYAAVNGIFQKITVFSEAKMAEKRMLKFWNPVNSDKQMINTDLDISFKDVSCKLGEKDVYSCLNLSIPLTGITIIKGENGSGKSILMKLALGLVKFQKGDISVGGVQPDQISYDNFPRKIFFLPQEDAEYHLTPVELYEMALEKQELSKAFSILRRLGIEDEMYARELSDLSGGERKKVFLSLAFAMNPEILIMDEPTNSLDSESCKMLYQLIMERTNGTIIITHDEGLLGIGSRIYEVQKGGVRFG